MTELLANGDLAFRTTDYSRYPLPPVPLNREQITFDRWKRYNLPSPSTGRMTSYTRATTLAGTITDKSALHAHKMLSSVAGVLRAAQLRDEIIKPDSDDDFAMIVLIKELERKLAQDDSEGIHSLIEQIANLNGAADARELGQAVHEWLAELDLGRVLLHQIPAVIQPYAHAYRAALQRAGMVAVPDYVERVVLNERGEEPIAGRIDRIFRCVQTDELVLADIKTSKDSSLELDSVLTEYGIQFAVYGYANHMLAIDGAQWEPMPAINQDYCLVVHVPSNQPERSQVVPFDLYAGGEGMISSITVRQQRRAIPKRVLSHATPSPSAPALRYVEAQQALQNIKEPGDPAVIFEQYEDVWTDELTRLGVSCIELLNPATDTDTEE